MKAIRDAQNERNISNRNNAEDVTQLFPLSVIEPYLLSEKVTKLSDTSTNDIHNCMILLLNNSEKREALHSEHVSECVTPSVFFETNGTQKYQTIENLQQCIDCKSDMFEQDVQRGDVICVKCGVVQRNRICFQSFNKQEDFKSGSDRDSDLKNWTLNSTIPAEELKRYLLTENMHHWNRLVCLPEDDLTYAISLVCSIKEKRKIKAKCIAALLYVRNRKNIDTWLKKKQGTIRLPPTPENFGECNICSHKFSTVRDKRFHHKFCKN